MAKASPARPVVHLPELPTHDEALRKQKRARTVPSWSDVHCEANYYVLCGKGTDAFPSLAPGNESLNRDTRSASAAGVDCVPLSASSRASHKYEKTSPSHTPQRPSGKPSMHTLIRQAAASTAPAACADQQNDTSRRQPGFSFLNRITKLRWKRAMDSALDASPMKSMLSHFSPSRFQRDIADDDGLHQMPDLLIPAHSATLEKVWGEILHHDVDSHPDISAYSIRSYHQLSGGCHTWEMPHMGPVIQSSATCDARLVAVLTDSRIMVWQTISSLPPINLAGLPVSDINSCLLTPSGQMLFLSSKAMIRVLWVKHQRPVPGIAISSVLTSHGGARWSQPHACGSGALLIGEGGELVVPDHSTVARMATDPSESHLLATTRSLTVLVWDLSQSGFSRHVIYQEPPVQVIVGAIPGPGMSKRPGASSTLRQSSGGGRNILATAMLSIAHSSRAKVDPSSDSPACSDKQQSWQGASFTEFLAPTGELLVHLASSGLLALIFSGSGQVATRFWPEKHAVYKSHSGVYVGLVGGLVVSCHDNDAVLWKIQANEASLHGLLQGHSAEILKASFDPCEARLVSVDTDGVVCLWNTNTLHQLLRMTLSGLCMSSCQIWSKRCAKGRSEHSMTESRELLESEGIELSGPASQMDMTSSTSQRGDEVIAAPPQIREVAFVSNGCDILLAGAAGELICIDSMSGATIWSLPAHLHKLHQAHFCIQSATMHVVDTVLVDMNGLIIRWLGPHRNERLKLRMPRLGCKKLSSAHISADRGPIPGVATIAAHLASSGQDKLLHSFCSSMGQKVALQCSIPTVKSATASKWSKIREVCIQGPSVTVTALHLLPVQPTIAILAGTSDSQIRVALLQAPVDSPTATQTLVAPEAEAGSVVTLVGRPSHNDVAAVYSSGLVLLWKMSPMGKCADPTVVMSGEQARKASRFKDYHAWAGWSEDGNVLVVSGPGGTLIWDAEGSSDLLPHTASLSGMIHGCKLAWRVLLVRSPTSITVLSASGQSNHLDSLPNTMGAVMTCECAALGGPASRFAVVPLANFSLALFSVGKLGLLPIGTCKAHHRRVTSLAIAANISVVASGDDGGTVFVWCAVTASPVQVLHVCGAPISSISFGMSDLWIVFAAADHLHFAWREHPTGQEVIALWLDQSRSVENCSLVTREILAVYPSLVNLKDQYGISLLAYASGISSERANKLLDVILDASPRRWAGLVCCTNAKESCNRRTDCNAAHADDEKYAWLGLKPNRVGPVMLPKPVHRLRVGELLDRQRSSYGVPAWDWKQTCGLQEKKIWNALELALLADFPSKIQAVLRSLISDVFTEASGVGVMPVIAILASKYPKTAALLIPDAPMQSIDRFYLPDLTEQDLDPLIAATNPELKPRDVKAMWLHEHNGAHTLPHKRLTLEVQASVCMWPHVATMGAGGLLHIIVKNNLDISLYGSAVVQGIIMHKWLAHARQHLLIDIFLFGVLMALFISDLSMIGTTMGRSFLSTSEAAGSGRASVATADGLLDTSAYGVACTAQELVMLLICARNLWLMKKRMHLTSFTKWLWKGWNSMDMASHLLLVVVLVCRLSSLHTSNTRFYISAAASCAVFLWSKMLFFMMPFSTTGPLIRMIIEITKDMIPFLGVLMIMIVGFSGSFYILFTPDIGQPVDAEEIPAEFADFQSTLLSTFLMILGSFDISTFKQSTPHSEMAIAMFCLYQVLGMIVLLNLLIAIMGDTFDRVREMESLHFWKGRAAVIDEIELAQQLGHGGTAGGLVGSKYLAPYLHTVCGTELTQLQKKQWGGKLRETKELITQLEQSISSRLSAIEKEVHMGNARATGAYAASRLSGALHLNHTQQVCDTDGLDAPAWDKPLV